MAVIQIKNFGGEIPRVPALALPPGAAQINQNLLATATEFRPLLDDSAVAPVTAANLAITVPNGAKTLYRMSKDANGAAHTDVAKGWIIELTSKNYVKGQINDDGTERTYITTNDGTALPQSLDNSGAVRTLGVPAPYFATAVKSTDTAYTGSQALAWAATTLVPKLHEIFAAALPDAQDTAKQASCRYTGGLPVAGAYSAYGMYQYPGQPWLAARTIGWSDAKAAGLNEPSLAPVVVANTSLTLQVACLPFWGQAASVIPALTAIKSPRDNTTQLLSADQISALNAALVKHFNPDIDAVKTLRTALDNQVKAFNAALDFLLTPLDTEPTFLWLPPLDARDPAINTFMDGN